MPRSAPAVVVTSTVAVPLSASVRVAPSGATVGAPAAGRGGGGAGSGRGGRGGARGGRRGGWAGGGGRGPARPPHPTASARRRRCAGRRDARYVPRRSS